MARIPYPSPESQSEEVRTRLQKTGSLNVNRMISHAEGPFMAYSKFGTQLLLRGKLHPVLREIVILRIGQLCDSKYEWHQHVSVAKAVGMDDATLQAVTDKAFDRLSEKQQIAISIAEEIKVQNGALPETIARAAAHFTPEELVEIIIVSGYYIMTAGLLLSLDIEIEDGPTLGESMAKGA